MKEILLSIARQAQDTLLWDTNSHVQSPSKQRFVNEDEDEDELRGFIIELEKSKDDEDAFELLTLFLDEKNHLKAYFDETLQKNIDISKSSLEMKRKLLDFGLSHTNIRKGINTARLGLIPTAPSDHLPIKMFTSNDLSEKISLFSWNLLSNDHLFNNLMNVNAYKEIIANPKMINSANCKTVSK